MSHTVVENSIVCGNLSCTIPEGTSLEQGQWPPGVVKRYELCILLRFYVATSALMFGSGESQASLAETDLWLLSLYSL